MGCSPPEETDIEAEKKNESSYKMDSPGTKASTCNTSLSHATLVVFSRPPGELVPAKSRSCAFRRTARNRNHPRTLHHRKPQQRSLGIHFPEEIGRRYFYYESKRWIRESLQGHTQHHRKNPCHQNDRKRQRLPKQPQKDTTRNRHTERAGKMVDDINRITLT